MPPDDGARIIPTGTKESHAFYESTVRAMALTAAINRLAFTDAEEIRALFSELIGQKVDDGFRLVPPFYTAHGLAIQIGRNVFINQNCTLYDLAEVRIGDEVMIGPNVSLLSAGHPLPPSQRRSALVGKPIVIGNNVWIAAGATVIGGVTVGENSVIAAASVVTHNVPANTLVAGNPARVIRALAE